MHCMSEGVGHSRSAWTLNSLGTNRNGVRRLRGTSSKLSCCFMRWGLSDPPGDGPDAGSAVAKERPRGGQHGAAGGDVIIHQQNPCWRRVGAHQATAFPAAEG